MDEDLKEALQELEYVHAAIWVHFDPGLDQGDKKQPKDIKKVLLSVRKVLRKHGRVIDGFQR